MGGKEKVIKFKKTLSFLGYRVGRGWAAKRNYSIVSKHLASSFTLSSHDNAFFMYLLFNSISQTFVIPVSCLLLKQCSWTLF